MDFSSLNLSPDLIQNIMKLAANQNLDLSGLNLGQTFSNNNPTRSPANQQDQRNRSLTPSQNSKAFGNNSNSMGTASMSKSNAFNSQNQDNDFSNSGNTQNFGNNNNRKPQGNKPNFMQNRGRFAQDSNSMNNNFGNNNQDAITVFMVAEKPSIARTIAEALGNGRSRNRKGISNFCQIHEWYGTFGDQKAFFKVTSVTGHIYVADFPTDYQDWRTVDPQTLFEAPTIKKEANAGSNIIEHLKNEAKDASYLILWLDNDREGENICFEVIDNVKDHLRKEESDQIFRVRFSSLVKEDLIYAFNNINSGPNFNESRSVDARQIIDLKVGVAFSRFQTRYLLRKYPNLNTKLVTFGPCQTPTLCFCVQRDDEIKKFTSQVFYKVIPTVIHQGGTKCELTWTNDRSMQIEEVQQVKADLEIIREVIVTEVTNKEATRGRPEALNTPQMLKTSSSQLGMGPQTTMQVAEKLYQQGYITYPRTESTSYPTKFDFGAIVEKLYEVQPLSNYCQKLSQHFNPPKHGKDAGDHPPITPTLKVPYRGNINNEEWKLYEFVARHFLATISPDAKMTNMQVSFQAGGKHKFHLKGTRLLDPGFTEITPWVKVYGNEIPEFFPQQRLAINSIDIKTGKTTPPDHLTESELINLMEQNGIGTDASMAQHINNICERNYVKVVGNTRKLVPTDLGSALIHSYQQIDEDLVAPNLRSEIEKRVDMIAKGQIDYDQVLQEVLSIFSEKFANFKQNVAQMDTIFSKVFGTFEDALSKATPFSTCGQCQNPFLFVESYNKLQCETCNYTLSLPMNGTVNIAGDHFCPLDGFQLLLFTSYNKITSFLICPMCSNKSPYPDVSSRLTCNLCPQQDCPYSSVNNDIGTCKCNKGLLVLDQMIESNLTASCNSCPNKLLLVENVHQFQRSESKCEQCSAYIFTEIELKDGRPPHENVCIFCHPEFSASVRPIEDEKKEKEKEKNMDRRPLEDTRNYGDRRQRNNQDGSLMRGSKKIFKPGRDEMNQGRPNFQRKGRDQSFGGRNQNQGFKGNQNQGFRRNQSQGFERNQSQGFERNQSQGFERKPNQGFGRNQNQNFNKKFNGQNWENPNF